MDDGNRVWTLEVLSSPQAGRLLEEPTHLMALTASLELARDEFVARYEDPDYPILNVRPKPGAVLIKDEHGQERFRYTAIDYHHEKKA
jgi:hypothetical protein